jgi:O-methyltransferase
MARTDLLKAVIRDGLARTGFTILRTESMEEHWRWNVEPITRLFAKVEQFTVPADDKRTKLLASLQQISIVEALFIVKCVHIAMAVEGDICEFGVAEGATSALLANEIRSTNRHIWLFDSFAGLPEPTEDDEVVNRRDWVGAMRHPRFEVAKRLRKIGFPQDRVHIVAGFFPESAKQNAPDRVCFAYVDFDLYRPIHDALEFVDQRMQKEGTIVVDDYGHPLFPGVRKAVDDFVSVADFDIVSSEYDKFAILTKHDNQIFSV